MNASTAPRSALRDRVYLGYMVGQGISQLGDLVWFVALSWSVVKLASPAVAGLVMTLSSMPRLALMLFGGALVDRRDARKLMIGSDALRAVVTLGAAGLALARPGIALLVVLSLVFGLADAVFMPAAGSLQPRLLQPDQYASGNAVYELVNRLALTVGAPLGGVLVAFGGLPLACLVDAATFAISVLSLWHVRPRQVVNRPSASEPYFKTLRDGLSYLVRNRVVGGLSLVGFLTNLGFIGPMNVGLAFLSHSRGWGASGVGLLLVGFGLGASAGAFVMLRIRIRGSVGLVLSIGALLQGSGLMGMVLSPSMYLAVGSSAMVGVLAGVMGVFASTVSQHHTDDGYRGRVSSVNTLASLGVAPQAMTVMGLITGAFGLTASFGVSAGLEVLAGLLCLAFPAVRRAKVTGPDQATASEAAEPVTVQ